MYADDLIVPSASVTGLQAMIDCCNQVRNSLLLKFNVSKSSCSVIGQASKLNIADMQLDSTVYHALIHLNILVLFSRLVAN